MNNIKLDQMLSLILEAEAYVGDVLKASGKNFKIGFSTDSVTLTGSSDDVFYCVIEPTLAIAMAAWVKKAAKSKSDQDLLEECKLILKEVLSKSELSEANQEIADKATLFLGGRTN
jgi:hypothetical protein